jgi:hypothetical protein
VDDIKSSLVKLSFFFCSNVVLGSSCSIGSRYSGRAGFSYGPFADGGGCCRHGELVPGGSRSSFARYADCKLSFWTDSQGLFSCCCEGSGRKCVWLLLAKVCHSVCALHVRRLPTGRLDVSDSRKETLFLFGRPKMSLFANPLFRSDEWMTTS